MQQSPGRFGAESELVEFILGITYEIWEERGVELIRRYYADDVQVYALSGLVSGAKQVVDDTYAMLTAFPDRLLLGENVIWSDEGTGQLSSHRILSTMTNSGDSAWGSATHRKAQLRTVAECLVQQGRVTEEWLVRDTLPLLRQLGFDEITAAQTMARHRDAQTQSWLTRAAERTASAEDVDHPWSAFAAGLLQALWVSGDQEQISRLVAPYAVAYPSPLEVVSGVSGIAAHYRARRAPFQDAKLRLDHVAAQRWARSGHDVAVRWSLVARHGDDYLGVAASRRDVYVLGVSHWRVLGGRMVADWSQFDQVAVLAQCL
ncbi:MAG: ester cyclase [Gammaproteobacteria bacterium]|nr:ester cyclase [Gammaproteobacteria bacterium]MDD9962697.1 ester cyclase [Gammaproteobacteria bacterium]MDE0273484.1 ester cyclase [Gammaproteobacteria bacterium]